MSIYLGQLGRMVELKCPSTQQVATAEGYSFEETLEGRVKAQARPNQRRTWSLSTSDATTPSQQATLLGFVNGEWGRGPFVFVSADAPVTNILSPSAASCDPSVMDATSTASGPVMVEGQWAGRSVKHSSGTMLSLGSEPIPVLPGKFLTFSAYVLGAGARVWAQFFSTSGNSVGSVSTAPTGTPTVMSRVHLTTVAPANAAYCLLFGIDGTQFARPAVTWTDQLFPWAAGEGCPKAVLHGASKNLVLASRDIRGGRYASLTYTVTEVG